jgi:hypothetical protein
METKELQFRNFKNTASKDSGCIPLHSWEKVYDFQQTDNGFPLFDTKTATISVWGCHGYYAQSNKTYDGMYAYAEVVCEKTKEVWHKSFFGESSETDALRWATDKAGQVVYG